MSTNEEQVVEPVEEVVDPTQEIDVTEADKQLDIDRDDRTLPVAKLMLSALAEGDGLIVGMKPTQEEKIAYYAPIAEKVIESMLENNVRMNEVAYTSSLVLEALQNITDMVESTLESSQKKAQAKLFGRAKHSDIEVNDVHKVLIA